MRLTPLIASLILPGLAVACGDDELMRDKTAVPGDDSLAAETAGKQPVAEGSWVYREDDPAALFGEASTEAIFVMQCDPGSGDLLILRAAEARGNAIDMHLLADDDSRQYVAVPAKGPVPMVEARIDALDMFLDDIASTGRLAVTVDGGDPLVMPVDETLRQLISDCRGRLASATSFTLGLRKAG